MCWCWGYRLRYHFYPRSPCGERRVSDCIHALLAESDVGGHQKQDGVFGISIHALLAESDGILGRRVRHGQQFLSTLSLRRATSDPVTDKAWALISIHALLAESDIYCHCFGASYSISIHALLAESDYRKAADCIPRLLFLSTLSLRRATGAVLVFNGRSVISIHALLAESDTSQVPTRFGIPNFYPRSPCGERPRRVLKCDNRAIISIHALLAESDWARCRAGSTGP